MTELTWSDVGERFFETGVDRGVLYVGSAPGVPWNGLVSVDEAPTGGELQTFYMDGNMYYAGVTPEEFRATIKAFYSPPEFDVCEGIAPIVPGLYTTRQPRVPFGFSYRTQIGNDVDGQEHGYEIHIVYNAIASGTDKSHSSINDSPDPSIFSWEIVSKPNAIATTAPSGHLFVSTLTMDSVAITQIEDVLYGTSSTPPRLPLPAELATLAIPPDLTIVTPGDGTFSASGADPIVVLGTDTFTMTDPDVVFIDADTYTATSP